MSSIPSVRILKRLALCLGVGMVFMTPACAQVAEGARYLTGAALMDKGDRILKERIQQGGDVGSGLINQALTGIGVLTEAARQAGNDVSSKTLQNMETQEAQVFLQLRDLIDVVENGADKVYSLQEVANLDISSSMSAVPFLKDRLYVSSLKGLSVADWENTPHRLALKGSGLGPGESGVSVDVSFRLRKSGVLLTPDGPPDRTQQYTNVYSFKKSSLRGIQAIDEIVSVPVDVTVTRVRRRTILPDATDSVRFPIVLTLYPETAGEAIVKFDVPTFAYVKFSRKEESYRTTDCGESRCGSGGTMVTLQTTAVANGSISDPPEGNRKVSNPTIRCTPHWDPQNCAYIYDLAVVVSADEKTINASFRTTTSPSNILVAYDILEWKRIAPVVGTFPVTLRYGKLLTFCLPRGASGGQMEITLKTHAKYQIQLGASVPNFLAGTTPLACASGGLQFTYNVLAPR